MSESSGGGGCSTSTTGSGSSSAPTSVPSNHDLSARTLEIRGIIAVSEPVLPRLWTKETGEIICELLTSKIDCDPCKVDKLVLAFGEPCPNEKTFDDGTFKAFVECFQSSSLWSLVDSGDENLKILKIKGASGQSEDEAGLVESNYTVTVTSRVRDRAAGKTMAVTGEYAIGLAQRKVIPAKKGCIVEVESTPDHAWVVVWKKGKAKTWSVCQVLSSVEVNFEDTACERLARAKNKAVDTSSIDLRKNGGCGPLGQEIMYVFGHVLWSRAALGLPLPESIPFAVVSGEKKREEASTRRLTDGQKPPLPPKSTRTSSDKARWVHGSLIIPQECGGDFTYMVDSFGRFGESSGDSALAAYLDVMMEGFDAGIKWMKRMKSDKKRGVPDENLFRSSALSGRELHFGKTCTLESADMKVVGSPVRMHENLRIDGEFVASQGELFRRVINPTELHAQTSGEKRVYWCFKEQEMPNEPVRVIVKVSSSACHARLHDVGISLLAQLTQRGQDWWEQKRKHLLSSLYAVYIVKTPVAQPSIIQLMPDFEEMGYVPLCPAHVADKDQMCQAFKSLVEETLLPLALEGIIHVDLRPGYNMTANVLYHPKRHVMRLIDLESLTDFDDYKTVLRDKRLISFKNGDQGRRISSAPEYVLLQAVCVASVWSSRMNDVTTELIIESYWDKRVRDDDLKELEAKESARSHIIGEFGRLVDPFLKDEKQL